MICVGLKVPRRSERFLLLTLHCMKGFYFSTTFTKKYEQEILQDVLHAGNITIKWHENKGSNQYCMFSAKTFSFWCSPAASSVVFAFLPRLYKQENHWKTDKMRRYAEPMMSICPSVLMIMLILPFTSGWNCDRAAFSHLTSTLEKKSLSDEEAAVDSWLNQ